MRKRWRRLFAGIIAAFLAIVVLSLDVTHAFAGEYVVTGRSDMISYDIFDRQNGKANYSTRTFTVNWTVGDKDYDALCARPLETDPPLGREYEETDSYGSDSAVTKAWFYGLGSGVDDGPLSELSYNQRVIIVHSVIAYETGDENWNGKGYWYLLGKDEDVDDGLWYANRLIEYAESNSLPEGWEAGSWMLAPVNSGVQHMLIYDEWYTPPKGYISVNKSSANSSVTDNNSNYTLEGAVFGIYSDSDCTDEVDTITTDSNGYGISGALSTGTYYVKEKSAPTGYAVNTSSFDAVVSSSNTTNVAVSETPYTGEISLLKYSANKSLTDGNSCYSLKDAKYGVYTDSSCSQLYTTMTTDENGKASVSGLPYRTYYVKEISASQGYELSTEIFTCNINSTTAVQVKAAEVPGNDPIRILLRKKDSEMEQKQGNAKLENAQYTVKYYDTYSNVDPSMSGLTAKNTWVYATDENGYISLRSNKPISGDEQIYDENGGAIFPYGTITIQETKAPEGYLLSDTMFVFNTKDSKLYIDGVEQPTNIAFDGNAPAVPLASEQVMKGKIVIMKSTLGTKAKTKIVSKIYKVELESKAEKDAKFEVYLKTAGSYADAAEHERTILVTDENGYAVSKDLPYGTYVVHQVEGANGFMFVEDFELSITKDNQTVSSNLINKEQSTSLRLYKKGEVVTGYDESNGFTYEERFVGGCEYGVYEDENCTKLIEKITTVNDTFAESANTYKSGTYYIKEISARAPLTLDDTVYPVVITNANKHVEIDVSEKTLVDKRQKLSINIKKIDADNENLSLPGAVFGIYADSDITDYKGNVVVNAGTLLEQVATKADGTASLTRDYPIGFKYSVKELVSPVGYGNKYEVQVIDARVVSGNLDTQVKSITYKDKHTSIVKTIASDIYTGTNQGTVNNDNTVGIMDHVYLEDLVVGCEYTLQGVIMDKETKDKFKDIDGNEVVSSITFVARSENQVVDVPYNFKAEMAGKSVVVFEKLIQQGQVVSSHEDINCVDQTIDYIKVKTTATDKNTKTHTGIVGKTTIIDEVEFENLRINSTYEIVATLYNKDTGEKILDNNGKEIVVKKSFLADKKNGKIEMSIDIDASLLAGKSVVVFEDVYYKNVRVSFHNNLADEGQTIHFPKIGTTAKDTTVLPDKTTKISDETLLSLEDLVTYENLIPGYEYSLEAVLMDKVSGKPLTDKDGKKVTSKAKFVADEANGTVTVKFSFKRECLQSLSTVVFEDLYNEGVLVTTHSDINSKGQTVTYKSVIDITKLDSTGIIKVLDGAKLVILDDKGEVVFGPFITTGEPTQITGLLPGKDYILRELEAPAGFNLAKDVSFKLEDSARIQHYSMTDEAIIGYVEYNYNSKPDWDKNGEVAANEDFVAAPKTGDNNNILLYLLMAGSSLLLLVYFMVKNKKGMLKVFGLFATVFVMAIAVGRTDTFAATTQIKKEETYTSADSNKEYDFEKTVKDGENTFRLTDVKYVSTEKKVEGTVTKSVVKTSDLSTYSTAEFAETITENGITYSLADVEKVTTGVGPRTQYLEETLNFTAATTTEAIPETVKTKVYDEVTGQYVEAEISLISTKVTNTEVSDDFSFSIKFYVTNGRYFSYKDNIITYNKSNPELMPYADEILKDLNLDSSIYKINSIEWDGEEYKDNGILCRNAVAKGNKVVNDYTALYGGDAYLPANNLAYKYVATYTADVTEPDAATIHDITAAAIYTLEGEVLADEDVVTIKKVGVFSRLINNHPAVVTFGALTVLIVISCVVVFLVFLKRRQMNKYEKY